MLNLVCYVWLYYNWFFVFNCICAVLRGSLLCSCGLSTMKIKELLLLLLLLFREQTDEIVACLVA